MTYIAKPKLHHPSLHVNKVGYTRRDYEGRVSTLCAGCGHDSIALNGSKDRLTFTSTYWPGTSCRS